MNFKKTILLLLKLLLSIGALCWVFSHVPIHDMWLLIKRAGWQWIGFAFALFVASKLFSAFRLNLFFRDGGIQLESGMNLKLYWLGMFYNQFLPGGVGGDAYKTYWISKKTKTKKTKVAKLILSDRLSGVLALTLLLLVLTGIHFSWGWAMTGFVFSIGLYMGYLIGLKHFKILEKPHYELEMYSFLVQFAQLGASFCLFKCLNIETQQLDYLLVFLASSIVAVFPITLGGLGAREFSFMIGSQYFGLNLELATCIGFLFYFISLVASLWGITYVFVPISLSIASPTSTYQKSLS